MINPIVFDIIRSMRNEFERDHPRNLLREDGGRIHTSFAYTLLLSVCVTTLLLALEEKFNFIERPGVSPRIVEGRLILDEKDDGCGPVVGLKPAYRTDNEDEQRLFRMVNQERIANGLTPLRWNKDLAEVGRGHANDMLERCYFSHINPESQGPVGRLSATGNFYAGSLLGENLALAHTVDSAHRGLMQSPSHRRNILDPKFEDLGVGAIQNPPHGIMFVQMFGGSAQLTHPPGGID